MADPVRPTSMQTHKLRRLAAAGMGERLLPQLFEARTEDRAAPVPKHVIGVYDVTQGLGLGDVLAERVQRLVAGANATYETKGGSQRLAHARGQLVEFLRTQELDSGVRQEVEQRALAFWRRTQKTDLVRKPVMRHVVKADAYFGDLQKSEGAGHKYIRRTPDGKGGWNYFYSAPADTKHSPLKEGSTLVDDDNDEFRTITNIEHKGDHSTFHTQSMGGGSKRQYTYDGTTLQQVKSNGERVPVRHDDRNHLRPTGGYEDKPKEPEAPKRERKKDEKVVIYSTERWNAGAAIKRQYGSATATKFHVNDPVYGRHDYTGYGKTASDRKKHALEQHAKKHGEAKAAPVAGTPRATGSLTIDSASASGQAPEGHVRIAKVNEVGGRRVVDHLDVPAKFHGNFAVHKNPAGQGDNGLSKQDLGDQVWRITHKQTGLSLGGYKTKAAAEAYAAHMHEHGGDALSTATFGQTDFKGSHVAEKEKLMRVHNEAIEVARNPPKKEAVARKSTSKGTPHITVERKADGSYDVREHSSKRESHAYGKSRQGADIYSHSVADAEKFGLDPRKHPTNDRKDREARLAEAARAQKSLLYVIPVDRLQKS